MKNLTSLIIFSLLLCFTAHPARAEEEKAAPVLSVGQKFPDYNFQDPHEKPMTIAPETKLLLLSFEMELSKGIHTWLSEKDKNYLSQHNAQYIADITPMPAIISYLFGKPKMRKYEFPIMLADDAEFGPKFPKEEEKITVMQINQDKQIESISFYKDMNEIAAAYFGEPLPAVTEEDK